MIQVCSVLNMWLDQQDSEEEYEEAGADVMHGLYPYGKLLLL